MGQQDDHEIQLMKGKLFFAISIFLTVLQTAAQPVILSPADSLARIETAISGNYIDFKAVLRPLQPIPGGRQPFYSYLWDFGDGHFSTEPEPRHAYLAAGNYEVKLYAVNNYDDGQRPPRPVKKQEAISEAMAAATVPVSNAEKNFFSANGAFQLAKNANALPGEDILITVGVHPAAGSKGRVIVLTNEKIYDTEGFIFSAASTYHDEKMLPADSARQRSWWASVSNITVTQSGSPHYHNRQDRKVTAEEATQYFSHLFSGYTSVNTYDIAGLKGEPQFSFLHFNISPEMLKDTNALITITGILIPDDGGTAYVHQLEVPVVASHDPNKMTIKQSRLSYRLLSKGKEMLYKVQFQNDGEGDARNIRLEINLPANLDPATFNLVNLSPFCQPCADSTSRGCWQQYLRGETLVFHFKDISLPGSRARDITNEDSTRGFIRFTVKPKRKLPNQPFRGQTNIYFDKNEPIKTNFATARFRKSLSPIVLAGFHAALADQRKYKEQAALHNSHGGALGLGLSPLAPYKKIFWQAELYANSLRQNQDLQHIIEQGRIQVDGVEYNYDSYDKTTRSSYLQLNIVPLQARYNIGRLISAGLGLSGKIDIPLSKEEERTYYIFINSQPRSVPRQHRPATGSWTNLRLRPFADINIGKVLLGPCIGFRYIYDGRNGQFLYTYAAWRF